MYTMEHQLSSFDDGVSFEKKIWFREVQRQAIYLKAQRKVQFNNGYNKLDSEKAVLLWEL